MAYQLDIATFQWPYIFSKHQLALHLGQGPLVQLQRWVYIIFQR
jgi:hypothetical protein